MEALWTLCAFPILGAADPAICSSYGKVLEKSRECAEPYLHHFNNGPPNSSWQLEIWMGNDCRNTQRYSYCMDIAVDECEASVALLVSQEVRNWMNFCYNPKVTSAVRDDFASIYDNYDPRCAYSSDTFRYCTDEMDRARQYLPLEQMSESIEEGIAIFRGLKADLMTCVQKGMRTMNVTRDVCAGTTWQSNYVALVVDLYGLAHRRPLGVYLDDTDVSALKALLQEVDKPDSSSSESDELEMLARGLFQ